MTYLLGEDMLFGYLYRNCGKDWHSIPFFWAFLRFKRCREQQIFWISLSGRSPGMVWLPGEGVGGVRTVPLPLSRFSNGSQLCPGGPALPAMLLALLACIYYLELCTIVPLQGWISPLPFGFCLWSILTPVKTPNFHLRRWPCLKQMEKAQESAALHTNRNALYCF